ncbi:hypothetical protein CBR_g8274 [Chara braunii]|uniref:CCHC-type domain-containing protein n=1 Tax=Chara braunii TaxID=69332 RepID=A0A388KLP0_CHABU|nr:hypothetical protein CBR_g8274 [Chara braunii]|eukprot:GBG70974.1 hypothetical protein CBR_g8274 [Chara braunii]
MTNGGYRGFGSDHDRDQYPDNRRDFGRDDHREHSHDVRGDCAREYERGPTYERSQDYRDQPRRAAPVCFECGEPGHYRNQCPRLTGEGSSRAGMTPGRSLSPNRQPSAHGRRSTSEDTTVKQQLEELAGSLASMKEHFDREQAKKDEKAKRKHEKKEKEEREKEERFAAKRCKVEEVLSEAESYESESSDVEALSDLAEKLTIHEKRKRAPGEVVGDSPPMETPAKRSGKRGELDPQWLTKRLQLSSRRPPLKKTPTRKTPRKTPRCSVLDRWGSLGSLRRT